MCVGAIVWFSHKSSNKVATGPGWLYLITQGLLLSVCVICIGGGFDDVVDNPVTHFIEESPYLLVIDR